MSYPLTIFGNPPLRATERDLLHNIVVAGSYARAETYFFPFHSVLLLLRDGYVQRSGSRDYTPTAKGIAYDAKHVKRNPSSSRRQQRAMYAAAAGRSRLGIPRAVGQEFVAADRRRSRRMRRNPETLPTLVAIQQSKRVYEVAYKHIEDGEDYKHKFAPGVCMELLADGSVRLYREDGRPLYRDFT